MRYYDLCVIGGGPAGLATALRLRQHNSEISIAVVESTFYQQQRVGESIAPGMEAILDALGASNLLNDKIHNLSSGAVSYWGSEQANYQDYVLYPRGRGWHLDRVVFDLQLVKLAKQCNIDLFCGYRYQASRLLDGVRQLTFCSQAPLRTAESDVNKEASESLLLAAAFTVDASGRAAKFTLQEGSVTHVLDSLVSIYGYFDAQVINKAYSTIVPFQHGWWYSAPLPGNKVIVAMMTDRDLASKLRFKSYDVWREVLLGDNRVDLSAVQMNTCTTLQVWPAYSLYRDKLVGNDWLAVGDAAVCYDPLSSQGIVKSLQQGIYAAHAINDYFLANNDHYKKTQALNNYVNSCSGAFRVYYASWCEYYRQEQRWRNSLFWARRFNPVGALNPYDLLTVARNRIVKPILGLSDRQYQQVVSACNGINTAWSVVDVLKSQWNLQSCIAVPDELIINLLQRLIGQGYIDVTEDKGVRKIASHV